MRLRKTIKKMGESLSSKHDKEAGIQAIQELQRKTEELERFFSVNLDLLCIANVEGRFTRVNKAWENILGYPTEYLEGKSFLDFVHPEDLAHTLEVMSQLVQQKHVLNFVNRYRAADGSYKFIEWRSHPYGQLIYAAARDITDRIQLEKQLQERERYLSAVLGTTQDGLVVTNAQNQIIDVNETYCRMVGYTRDELLGRHMSDLIAETQDSITAVGVRLRSLGAQFFESRHRKKDGSVFEVEVALSIMHLEQSPIVSVSFIRDITERKNAEKALLNSRDLMSYNIEHNKTSVLILDKQLQFMYVSQPYLDTYGLKREDVIGKRHYEVFPDLPQKWREAHAEALQGNITRAEEDQFIRSDGSLHWASWECRPWYEEEGQIAGVVVYTENINERKRIEQDLFTRKEQFRTTLLSVGDGVISTDNTGNINVMNPIAEKLTGWTQAEAIGRELTEVLHLVKSSSGEAYESPVKTVLKTLKTQSLDDDFLLISRDGRKISIEITAAPIKDREGQITGVVVVFRDITEKREKLRQIEYLSFRDHLTGLYNRRYVEDAMIRLDTARNLPFAILVLDVNGLKLVNDAFGHEMGDRLLITVADILKETCRTDDIIGRMGGDEFFVLLPRTELAQAEKIKQRILAKASATKLESVIVSLAVGAAVKTEPQQDIKSVLTEADNKMYKAKITQGKIMRNQTIELLLRNINLKYDLEQIHTERVSQFCEAISRALKLSEKEIQDIKTVGVLHDVGKIIVPPELLNKSEKLTDQEFAVIKKHPETGYQVLKSVDQYVHLADAVLYHHEKWDGTGYPQGLKGEEIPFYSRIIAVTDAFEAMTAQRPYQKSKSKEEARLELIRCAGTQFDPKIVQVFVEDVI